ncbi:MAG TPA: hypothetical protein VHQ65_09225 [Thermoanaerobaculia bacterium]|nr:hypothetical protein [Thermoanaerobaculia bacterium]
METTPTAPTVVRHPPALLRYAIGFVLIFYGFAKVMGSQFTILDSELDKPMGEVSGFWLTWYYFGYSAVYGNLIALGQIGGGLLLTFRRTALLGAAILFGIVSNIVLINFFFGIPSGATGVALLLWLGLLAILVTYRDRLRAAFWPEEPAAPRSAARTVAAWGTRLAMLGLAAALTYWAANVNNRRPTPLDGRWSVATADPAGSSAVPTRIYFERNRAYMAVFRTEDSSAVHHFEVDPASRSVQVWEQWLRKGDPLFTGTYTADANRVSLTSVPADAPDALRLELVRISGPGRVEQSTALRPPG